MMMIKSRFVASCWSISSSRLSMGIVTFALLLTACAVPTAAYLPRTQSRSTRYFTTEQVLPAIASVSPTNNNNTSTATAHARSKSSTYGAPVPVVYTNSPKSISEWLSDHIPSSTTATTTASCAVLGFDMESVSTIHPWLRHATFDGPATVQLATPKSCLVIHLLRKSGRPSVASVPILEAVLSDDSIIKAGVGIDKDMVELYECWGSLEARSRLDLGGIGSGKDVKGLKRLSKAILDIDLPKSKRLAVSNWCNVPLSHQQLAYSARDAWAGAAIVEELIQRDPNAFNPARLCELLQDQPSVEEMYTASMERRFARSELTSLLAPFRSKENHSTEVPKHVQQKAVRLRSAIKDMAPLSPMAFDVSRLGIEI